MSLLISTLLGSSDEVTSPFDGGVVVHAQRITVPSPPAKTRANEIAIISHELRNSLGVVRNAARLLRLQVGADGVERARVLIERHVGQMSRHIEDLLETAPLGGRKEALRLAYVDLRTVLRNAVDAITPDLERRSHRLAVELPENALWVHADAARLEQVFSNLLINAAKYTPDGGEISLGMECLERHASVRIRDSGIGIAPAELSRIFELFVQVDATAPLAESGRGIGLAVVRDLVEMHGGSVDVASAGLTFGSEFTVLLPALWKLPAEEAPRTSAQ
ncbi:MAG: HAMP domain-containing sensor histidine kinase [Pseudomonadota bacterium]